MLIKILKIKSSPYETFFHTFLFYLNIHFMQCLEITNSPACLVSVIIILFIQFLFPNMFLSVYWIPSLKVLVVCLYLKQLTELIKVVVEVWSDVKKLTLILMGHSISSFSVIFKFLLNSHFLRNFFIFYECHH